MTTNLLRKTWTDLDSSELKLLLDARIGGPGQFDGRDDNPKQFYLPLGRESCRIALTYAGSKIVAIEPGPAFDPAEWERVSEEIEKSILTGPVKVGREYSFCSFRVVGSWRGDRSGVQILPPPGDAPRAEIEMAEHPFILEFSIQVSDFWPVTNHRRLREHRKLSLLLNVLLRGRVSLQPRQQEHFWAALPRDGGDFEYKWANRFFFAKLGKSVIDEASQPAAERLEEVAPEEYYAVGGHDGRPLRVPADLDEFICRYMALSSANRTKFDRATFWVDLASRQWTYSVSASFASLVSAIESLTDRGKTHRLYCDECKTHCTHEVPGATEKFRAFFETYAPGASMRKRRSAMYSLRSGILHGSELMQLDQEHACGLAPPWWNQYELQNELWGLTRVALRNWLRSPPAA
jgi:hypothetical protein